LTPTPPRRGPASLLTFLGIPLWLGIGWWSPARAAAPLYDTAEIVLRSSQTFNGNGTPNPFTTVEVTVAVTSPDGRTFQVDGFFDGNGSGGAIGDVFKARIFLDRLGTWSWTSSSATAGLGGQSGQIVCQGTLPGTFGKGPLITRGPRPRSWAHADGTPILLLGKMLDFDAPNQAQFTTFTFFSEALSDTERRNELDYQHELGVNTLGIYLFNDGDFGGSAPTNPWVGSCPGCDRTRFDLAHWTMYDAWTRRMRDEGMVAQLWFFADESGVGGFSMADRLRLIRYGMARLLGYANTAFVLTLEWEEAFSAAEVEQAGHHLQAFNPWRRPASVHGVPGPFDFPQAVWADYMDVQADILGSYQGNHADALAAYGLASKPSFMQEFAQGYESGFSRIKAWCVFLAAQAGIGSGAYLEWLAKFAAAVPFYKLEPADALVLAGEAYALAEPGYHYVVYLYRAGPVTLDLRGAAGSFEAQWFDPLTGLWSPAGTIAAGGTPTFTPSGGDDKALWLRPLVTGSTPPPRVTGLGFPHRASFDWEATTGATSFDVVKGSLATLRAQRGFTASVMGCIENDGTDHRAAEAATPSPGQAIWYLVRGVRSTGVAGSFAMAVPRERPGRDAEIGASSARCP
jgi:hypothetical protein